MNNLSTKRIALFGEWNTTNLGDRAIGYYASKFFLKHGYTIKLFSLGSLSYVGEISSSEGFRIFFERVVPEATQEGATSKTLLKQIKTFLSTQARLKIFLRKFRNDLRFKELKKQVATCSLIIVGGGALLDDESLHFPQSLQQIIKLKKELGIRLYSLGCGTSGKFSRKGREIITEFVNSCEIVQVRDAETQKTLESLSSKRIQLFGDFALEVEKIRHYSTSPTQINKIAFNIATNVKDETLSKYLDFIKATIPHLPGYKLCFFTTGNACDNQICTILKQNFPDIPVLVPTSLQELLNYYTDFDVVIATRLHAAILSLSSLKPVIALDTNGKLENFFNTLSLNNFVVNIREPNAPQTFLQLINKPRKIHEQIENVNVEQMLSNREEFVQYL